MGDDCYLGAFVAELPDYVVLYSAVDGEDFDGGCGGGEERGARSEATS